MRNGICATLGDLLQEFQESEGTFVCATTEGPVAAVKAVAGKVLGNASDVTLLGAWAEHRYRDSDRVTFLVVFDEFVQMLWEPQSLLLAHDAGGGTLTWTKKLRSGQCERSVDREQAGILLRSQTCPLVVFDKTTLMGVHVYQWRGRCVKHEFAPATRDSMLKMVLATRIAPAASASPDETHVRGVLEVLARAAVEQVKPAVSAERAALEQRIADARRKFEM